MRWRLSEIVEQIRQNYILQALTNNLNCATVLFLIHGMNLNSFEIILYQKELRNNEAEWLGKGANNWGNNGNGLFESNGKGS